MVSISHNHEALDKIVRGYSRGNVSMGSTNGCPNVTKMRQSWELSL